MITRTDKLTEELKKVETYSDFMVNFTAHPISGNLLKIKNEDAVKMAVKNRVMTGFSERLYNPFIGSNVKRKLFEPNDSFLKEDIKKSVENSLQNDSRINLIDVVTEIKDHTANIMIYFQVINNPTILNVAILLRRVR